MVKKNQRSDARKLKKTTFEIIETSKVVSFSYKNPPKYPRKDTVSLSKKIVTRIQESSTFNRFDIGNTNDSTTTTKKLPDPKVIYLLESVISKYILTSKRKEWRQYVCWVQ